LKNKNKLIYQGKVIRKLPDCRFKVKLFNIPEANGNNIILSYLCGKMRKNNIRVDLGDKVVVELSPYDLKRGRIVLRK